MQTMFTIFALKSTVEDTYIFIFSEKESVLLSQFLSEKQ